MGKKANLVKELRKFMKEVNLSVDQVYLFGSQATGKAGKGSDVDLLLVSKSFAGKRKLKRAPPFYLKWNLDYPVDFICLTPEEFRQRKKETGVVQEAVKKGIKIV
ncbi:nucleotidyltransferase [Candidatus Woesearchaeota archaeon CG10_big_fil_rev_8_21_14_0_10_45_16]|nr:MAG: nucleotidyltransferase [Candidatus Woesearchaeota archaeon CG10_big_fil_rev_8_21_14_0_10_45_16]